MMNSYMEPCPNCGKPAQCYDDTRDRSDTGLNCLHCGYFIKTTTGFETLAALNEMRMDNDMPRLKKLPKRRIK